MPELVQAFDAFALTRSHGSVRGDHGTISTIGIRTISPWLPKLANPCTRPMASLIPSRGFAVQALYEAIGIAEVSAAIFDQ
mmetsp:Transcript_35007/g.94887  ORF Transcript_35007/g.94887 Transcript_35007/m.94887 type:complete len:81 (+) Transcript_35007:822-1064(+)